MDTEADLQFALVRQGPGMKNKVVYLNGENAVGRGVSSSITLLSKFVSREHCRIYWDASKKKWMVEDNGSMNGTCINDELLSFKEIRELRIGDFIGLGIDYHTWLQNAHVKNNEDYFVYKFTHAPAPEFAMLCNNINQMDIDER